MKILIITGFFPPYCPPATTRMPSFARYLLDEGHDVRVICPYQTQYKPFLKPGIEKSRITYIPYFDVDSPAHNIKGAISKFLNIWRDSGRSQNTADIEATIQAEEPARRRATAKLRAWAAHMYMMLIHFPDRQWTWIRPARKAVDEMFKSWKPDILFVSTPPYSQMFLANKVSRQYGIPWVAEYRDTWSVQPYYSYPKIRQSLELKVERRVVKSADALFAVTYLAAEEVGAVLDRPILVARNGYDQEDFEGLTDRSPLDKDILTIIYGGAVYGGLRDPSPLFEALSLLRSSEGRYQVIIYTSQQDQIAAAAHKYGVESMVDLRAPIERESFLQLEVRADVLLMLRGTGRKEDSVVPGKLYEYIGAQQPILCLGSVTGEAVDIVREEGLGLVSNTAEEIARQLETWWRDKTAAGGKLPSPDVKDPQRYSRKKQFEKILEQFTALAPGV